ncbi:ATP-binding cassette domain-containing protein [Bifidobacterium sp. UMB1197]|nr:ATP-binding cassette domain-containing protein [Bifidobacterium sp. UMB1197]
MPDAFKTQVLNETKQHKAETFLPSAFSAAQLRFENWGYRHASRKAFAVRGLNLTIEAGQRVLLLGASGIGKSTILEGAAGLIGSDIILKSDSNVKNNQSSSSQSSLKQNVLVEDEDGGVSEGAVFVDDVPVHKARGRVGLVLQDPEAQAIFQRLGDNVAFGPENMNVPRKEIWNIVDESLKEVGLDGLQLHRSTAHLSGGQMQRLALAGALAMKPSVLLLDEPTANLDPDGVEQIVAAVKKVLDNTHATMVLVEHHAQPWIDLIDRVIVLGLDNNENVGKNGGSNKGETFVHDDDIARGESAKTVIVADGTPDQVFNRKDLDFEDLGIWLPDKYKDPKNRNITRIHVNGEPDCDPSVGDGKVVLSTKNLAISHTDTPIAKNINLEFNSGQITALVGANGAGKSTLSLTLAGLIPSLEGEVVASEDLCKDLDSSDPIKWKSTELAKRISYVFQNPEHQFACGTVLEEVMLGPIRTGMSEEDARSKAQELLERFRLLRYANANPYTLSGGEKRRLTVAASLAAAPRVLILDEPTFGQDRKTWMQIIKLIASLRADGVSVIVVTHDKELVDALGARLVELLPVNDAKNSDSGDLDDLDDLQESPAAAVCDSSEALSSTTCATNISRIKVSAVNKRDEQERAASCSPFLASLNPVYRMLGAFLLSVPLIFTLDWLSSSIALVLEFVILWIVGMNPWRVIKQSWPVWVGAPGSALAVWLYGKPGGEIFFNWGIIQVSEHSTTLAIATFIRILAIGVPAIVTVIGIDATDLADAFSQVMHLPDKFVYGGLAGMRLFSVLQDDWAALTASRRSRGLGDDSKIRAFMPQAFALLVLSIRRSSTLATAMQARGFGGKNPRSHARISYVNKRDYVFMAGCLIIPAIALIAAVYYGTFAFLGGD